MSGKAILDALTEAALERDQATYADWWVKVAQDALGLTYAQDAFRRGYAAAWQGGAIDLGRAVQP